VPEESLSHLIAATGTAGTGNTALAAAVARARDAAAGRCAVILVEGPSDQAAVGVLAARRGRDLDTEGVFVVPMGGATNIGHFLDLFGPRGLGVTLAGLCDEGEEGDVLRGLARAGLHPGPARADAERLGFYVCVADLEDEMIRSLGTARVEQLIAAQGELTSFRTFCRQPAQRNRSRQQQLRRFMGTRSGRKLHYARVLASSLEETRVPRPLDRVLAHV
jgi:Overcoming lysogenization defect protein-like, TOPRIM domain